MKCNYCGGEVASDQEKCPFCDNINEQGVLYQNALKEKMTSNESLKKEVIGKNQKGIAGKILTRAIIIAFVLLILNIAAGVYLQEVSTGAVKKWETAKTSEKKMKEYLEKEEYGKLYTYMTKQDLIGEKYDTYSQIVLVNSQYERFIEYRNEWIDRKEKGEVPDRNNLSSAIHQGFKVLYPDIYAYPDIQPETAVILKEQQASVMVFFRDYLKIAEDELDDITEDSVFIVESDRLSDTVLHRSFGGEQ